MFYRSVSDVHRVLLSSCSFFHIYRVLAALYCQRVPLTCRLTLQYEQHCNTNNHARCERRIGAELATTRVQIERDKAQLVTCAYTRALRAIMVGFSCLTATWRQQTSFSATLLSTRVRVYVRFT